VTVDVVRLGAFAVLGTGVEATHDLPHVERLSDPFFGSTAAANGHVETTPGPTFEAADPKGSVLQATFVESDRAEMREDDDCALTYWMETAPATGEMVARGAVVRGAADWSAPFDLSVAAGKRRVWKPHGEWLGDYMKGAFFFDGAAPCFLAQWPESSPPNIDLHANVVSLPRRRALRAAV